MGSMDTKFVWMREKDNVYECLCVCEKERIMSVCEDVYGRVLECVQMCLGCFFLQKCNAQKINFFCSVFFFTDKSIAEVFSEAKNFALSLCVCHIVSHVDRNKVCNYFAKILYRWTEKFLHFKRDVKFLND